MTLKKKPYGYWTDENTIIELEILIKEINHFPTSKELKIKNRQDLSIAIQRHGGFIYFRRLLGYKLAYKSVGYWTEENTVIELEVVIKELNHFPSKKELGEINKNDLIGGIRRNGGINHFRKLLGYKPIFLSWNEERIVTEVQLIISNINHFPTDNELRKINRIDLLIQISQHGGFNHFRNLLGYEIIKKSKGYWIEETIIAELKFIIEKLDHFPSKSELSKINREDLNNAIHQHGGFNHFKKKLGFTLSMQETYASKLHSYVNKRGRKSEYLIKEILIEWCQVHDLPQPNFNVKLAKGNVIEFVCDFDKKIGIDVTNTKANKHSVYITIQNKWRHKDYRLYLDELWIVVFTDVLSSEDYDKLNMKSPDNVRVLSIDDFLKELDYSIEHYNINQINNLKNCSFHNKEEMIGINKMM